MSLLVSLRDVTKSVTLPDDTELHILKGISLDLHEGDRLAVVGRSGGGKSTLLNLLGLLDVPTGGELEFLGLPAQRMSEAHRARVRGESVGAGNTPSAEPLSRPMPVGKGGGGNGPE